jgi:hypothetical protein
MMRTLANAVTHRRARPAALAATKAAIAAVDACDETPTTAAQLMRLELTGLAAWLHAHGMAVDFPRRTAPAVEMLVKRLRANGHPGLADSLASNVAAALAIPVRINGNVHVADRLVKRVDEVEKVIH